MSVDIEIPEEGLGLWRGRGKDWEGRQEITPQFDGSDDPTARSWLELRDSIERLGVLLSNAVQPDPPTGVATGNTDASGNAFIVVYAVAAGMQFRLHRAVVEAQGSTPTAPSSAGWYGFYSLQSDAIPGGSFTNIGDTLQGSLKDFAPSTVGGPTFPAVFTDNSMQAVEVRGPSRLVLVVSGGPASKRVTVNYQGSLRRAHGVE
jgi:hypothetical protein